MILIAISCLQIRSGLAELELKTSQVLQRLENVKTAPTPDAPQQSIDFNANTSDVTDKSEDLSSSVASNSVSVVSLLHGSRKPPSEILKSLETLISYAESEDEPEFPLPALDDVSHLALISHSIVAYLSHLDRSQTVGQGYWQYSW